MADGNQMLDAARLAVEEVNAQGGVLGRDVELIVRDTKADPDVGTQAMTELIDDEGVVAIVGEVHSSVALAEIEVAHDRGIPFIVADAWADGITAAQYEEVFRIAPVNSLIYDEVGNWLQETGFENVAIVSETTAFGAEASAQLSDLLSSSGATATVIDVDPVSVGGEDVVDRVAGGGYDLVMTLVASDTVYPVITALCEAGIAPAPETALYVGAGTGVTPTFWDEVGSCGRYVIAEHLVAPEEQWNTSATDVAAALDAPQGEIGSGGFASYDAVLLATDAIERADSTDPGDILTALGATDLEGTRGDYTFSSETEPAWHFQQFLGAPMTVIQYSEDDETPAEAVILAPEQWATADTYLLPD